MMRARTSAAPESFSDVSRVEVSACLTLVGMAVFCQQAGGMMHEAYAVLVSQVNKNNSYGKSRDN